MFKLFLISLLVLFQGSSIEPINPYCDKGKVDFPMPPYGCPNADDHLDELCVELCYDLLYWKQLIKAHDVACREWNAKFFNYNKCINTAIGNYEGCLQASVTPAELQECYNIYIHAVWECDIQWAIDQSQIFVDLTNAKISIIAEFYDCVENACCWPIHKDDK